MVIIVLKVILIWVVSAGQQGARDIDQLFQVGGGRRNRARLKSKSKLKGKVFQFWKAH